VQLFSGVLVDSAGDWCIVIGITADAIPTSPNSLAASASPAAAVAAADDAAPPQPAPPH